MSLSFLMVADNIIHKTENWGEAGVGHGSRVGFRFRWGWIWGVQMSPKGGRG